MSYYDEFEMRETARRDREFMEEVDRSVSARLEREKEYYANMSYFSQFDNSYERFMRGDIHNE